MVEWRRWTRAGSLGVPAGLGGVLGKLGRHARRLRAAGSCDGNLGGEGALEEEKQAEAEHVKGDAVRAAV